jgi:tRNA threonylcarbamoyladenosine biosynthesis protein TsaE
MQFKINSEAAMKDFGATVARVLKPGNTLELIGDVGAGKTTLIKGLAHALGATEDVASPSFTISRVYDIRDGLRLYHYDFYRLNDAGILREELREVTDDPTAITVIEWADIVDDVLPDPRLRLTIRATGEMTRTVLLYGLPEGTRL